MLLRKRAEIAARLVEDRDRLERVERALHRLEGAAMTLDIVLKSVPPLRVATVVNRHLAAGFDDPIVEEGEAAMRDAGRRLVEALDAGGVRRLGPLFFFYDEGPGAGLTPHTAVAVGDQPLPADGVVVERTLPAVEVVAAVYRGAASHSVIGPVYGQLAQWAEDHGYRVLGPGRDHVIEGGTGEADGPVVLELQLPVEAV